MLPVSVCTPTFAVALYSRWVALLRYYVLNVAVPHCCGGGIGGIQTLLLIMASALCRLGWVSAVRNVFVSPAKTVTACRTAACFSSGAILPKPKKTPFGLWRIAAVVVPSLYMGTRISKNFAEVLEEHDIFVPEDDDDD
ncbi:essential MCU regulator, mitochondrial-like [Phycodurus eques]|uniref:essential MCU regulator, mitochondrial-like n=1 Tax=Phycodurus eques TaxID=693459 RepID=UPI002ACE2A57|nr:essential MCU regulator, mitochondrial-like [Phycodurus eques]